MPCFSCFTWHFHQIAGLSTVLWDDAHGACVGVVGSVVLLCGERSLWEETSDRAGPFVPMLCSSDVEGCESWNTGNKFCQWQKFSRMFFLFRKNLKMLKYKTPVTYLCRFVHSNDKGNKRYISKCFIYKLHIQHKDLNNIRFIHFVHQLTRNHWQ